VLEVRGVRGAQRSRGTRQAAAERVEFIKHGSYISAVATPILRAAPLFAALADPTRLAILERLRRGERCVSELCGDVSAGQSLISFHLKALRDAGIVFARKDGRTVWYAVDPSGVVRLERLVQLLKDAGDHVDQVSQAADLEMCLEYINGS
jgi:ArsR family transcriptional regulator, arsenate/arsenite/antimonite-responsive transcriptional repressor